MGGEWRRISLKDFMGCQSLKYAVPGFLQKKCTTSAYTHIAFYPVFVLSYLLLSFQVREGKEHMKGKC